MFYDPKFWLSLSFLAFLLLLIKYAIPKIINAIDDKSKQVANNLYEARKLKEQAEDLLKKAQKYHKESIEFSKKLIDDTNLEVVNLLTESQNLIQKEVSKKIEQTKQRIQQEQDIAIRSAKNNIITSAIKNAEDKSTQLSESEIIEISKKSIKDIKF